MVILTIKEILYGIYNNNAQLDLERVRNDEM